MRRKYDERKQNQQHYIFPYTADITTIITLYKIQLEIVKRRITTFRSMTDRIYDGGPISIIILKVK